MDCCGIARRRRGNAGHARDGNHSFIQPERERHRSALVWMLQFERCPNPFFADEGLGVSIIHSVADQFFPGTCVRSLPLTEMSRLFSHSRDGSS